MKARERDSLFPSSKFIIDGQGDTFLEASLVVSSQAHNEAVHLHSQADIEVLGHVAIRPEFAYTIFLKGDSLDGFPAQEGVVTDKGSAITVADGELNGHVDEVGKVCDAVFESVIGDLHDARGMLEDGNFGGFVEFKSTKE